MQKVKMFTRALFLTVAGSCLVRKVPTAALLGSLLLPLPVVLAADATNGAVTTGTHLEAIDLPTFQAIPGQRGAYGFSCLVINSTSATHYTLGTWTGYLHSASLNKRYGFTVNCNSSIRDGQPNGAWPVIPTTAGVVTFQSTLQTSTVIAGKRLDAPAMTIAGNAYVSGSAITNLSTGDGQVFFDLAVPLAVN